MRLGDLDDLKVHISELILVYSGTELENAILNAIDNAPTIIWCSETPEGYPLMDLRHIEKGKCKTCRHRDPEDKKCDCGELERQGCPFPVSDDYFCKFYEKGGA